MSKIRLVTDGASDITKEECEKYGIINVPFYTMKSGDVDSSREYTNDELYDEMLANPSQQYKTACPSTGTFYDVFEKEAKDGNDIICVCITQAFSGSYNSALIASEMIKDEYPNIKINVIDSRMNTVLQGLYVLQIQKMIDSKLSFEVISQRCEELKPDANIIFTVESIKYLRHGGRIGALKSFIAQSLQIKPIIHMTNGDIKQSGIGLGITRALKSIISKVQEYLDKLQLSINDFCFSVGYSCNKELAIKFMESCKNLLGINNDNIEIRQIGCTSAVHTGPNTIGVAFLKKAF